MGFRPRLMLHAKLGTMPAQIQDSDLQDPVGFAASLASQAAQMYEKKSSRRSSLARVARGELLQGEGEGDYVLVHQPRPGKLGLEWKGPFVIIEEETPFIFKIQSILTGEENRAHVNGLHLFHAGSLSSAELEQVALPPEQLLVKHQGTLEQQWMPYADCRFCPAVKQYCKEHGLHPHLH